jgi:hypothetical protein
MILGSGADEVVEASIAACERRDPVCITGRVNQAIAGLAKLVPHAYLPRKKSLIRAQTEFLGMK